MAEGNNRLSANRFPYEMRENARKLLNSWYRSHVLHGRMRRFELSNTFIYLTKVPLPIYPYPGAIYFYNDLLCRLLLTLLPY